jgi:hypothetical protein
MTVSTETNKKSYEGTGANTTLPTTFPFESDSDLVVTQRVKTTGIEATLVLGTHYTVTGGGFANGTVTPVDGATDFPVTVDWVLSRNTPQTQETDYVDNDDFPAESHENALDKVTYLAQDRQEAVNRSLKVPITDPDPSELPNKIDRASKHAIYDSNGDPGVGDAPADTTTVSTFGQALIVADDDTAARVIMDSQEDVITTQGDLVRGSSEDVAERLAIGASGTYLRSDGTDQAWAAPEDQGADYPLPQSYLSECNLVRTDADTITIPACEARNSDNTESIRLASSLAKTINETWVAGAGGGLNATDFASGTDDAEASTWYHVFLIKSAAGVVDVGFDKDVDATELLDDSGYTKYRRIGSVKTDVSKDILAFKQDGDDVWWDLPVEDIVLDAMTTDAVTHTLGSVPIDVRVKAIVAFNWVENAVGFYIVGHGDISGVAVPTADLRVAETLATGNAGVALWSDRPLTNTSAQIASRTDVAADLNILVLGWEDRRGQ